MCFLQSWEKSTMKSKHLNSSCFWKNATATSATKVRALSVCCCFLIFSRCLELRCNDKGLKGQSPAVQVFYSEKTLTSRKLSLAADFIFDTDTAEVDNKCFLNSKLSSSYAWTLSGVCLLFLCVYSLRIRWWVMSRYFNDVLLFRIQNTDWKGHDHFTVYDTWKVNHANCIYLWLVFKILNQFFPIRNIIKSVW